MGDHNYVFKCDPSKNKECKKTSCQRECHMTTKREYSLDGKLYRYNQFFDNFEEVNDEQSDSYRQTDKGSGC